LDANALATAAAQTLQAQSAILTVQAGGQAPPAPPPSGSTAPVISASVDTNCRVGPGPEYEKVGYLGKGQQAAALGKEPSGNWWLIANPQNPAQTCWVWTSTTTLSGDPASVPLNQAGSGSQLPSQPDPIEPPPEEGFMSATVDFSSIIVCSQSSWAVFHALNTSSLWIKSVETALLDSATHRNLNTGRSNRPFLQAPQGCPPGITDLKPGSEGYFAVKFPPSVDVGDSIDATVTLCSEPNQVGKCASILVTFTIPAAMPPPPGPPPGPADISMHARYSNVHECDNAIYVTFEIQNAGSLEINSIDIGLTNLDSSIGVGHTNLNRFVVANQNSCFPGTSPFTSGQVGYTLAIIDPDFVTSGQSIESSIKACSEKDLGGVCTTVLVQFTYP